MPPKKGKKKGKGGKKSSLSSDSSSSPDNEVMSSVLSSSSYMSYGFYYEKYQKSEKKLAKELRAQTQSVADSRFWEARYLALEETKNDFRLNAQQLATENDLLMNQIRQTESDTIDVVTYLKKEDQKKDCKIEQLETEIKSSKRIYRLDKQKLIDGFNTQIFALEKQIAKKQEDISLMQQELMHVKEFRKKRALMQRELDEIRDTMFLSNREHKEETSRLEQKFLEERISLKKEADQKISELADRAHQEAIINLDDTTRVVYKENIDLVKQLGEIMKEEQVLRKFNSKLREEHNILKTECENLEDLIKAKQADSLKKTTKISQLHERVELLERALSHMIREFDEEKQQVLHACDQKHETSRLNIIDIQQHIVEKVKECRRVRQLAKRILNEKEEIEKFFLDSLDYVNQQILHNQEAYKKAATKAYNRRMIDAFSGSGDFPKVRTFTKSDSSTNSVYKDLQAAEKLMMKTGAVDITDLTWEQREKVLRYLFARIHGSKKPLLKQTERLSNDNNLIQPAQQLPIAQDGSIAGNTEAQFYPPSSEQRVSSTFSRLPVLPDITVIQAPPQVVS